MGSLHCRKAGIPEAIGRLINITNYITDNKNIIFDIRNISNKLITDLIFI